MSGIGSLFKSIVTKVPAREREAWRPIRIPHRNCGTRASPTPVREFEDYIGLRVNQLFLASQRKWFTEIEPAVFASVEFLYGGRERTDARVFGPMQDNSLPARTVLRNQTVFGLHPFRGGPITWTVVLTQLPVRNIARPVLDILEGTGGLLKPGLDLVSHIAIGRILLDGFERLAGLDGAVPVLAVRETIDVDKGDAFVPGHVALIAGDPIPADQLWVIDAQLNHGPTQAESQPLSGRDFVLLEFTRAPDGRRSDIERLPFHSDFDRALEAAGKASDDAWAEAKAILAAVVSLINRSADLTNAQKGDLIASYKDRVRAARDHTLELQEWSAAPATTEDQMIRARQRMVREILEME